LNKIEHFSKVSSLELFETLIDRLEDESDLNAIRGVEKEPLHEQNEAEEYIMKNITH